VALYQTASIQVFISLVIYLLDYIFHYLDAIKTILYQLHLSSRLDIVDVTRHFTRTVFTALSSTTVISHHAAANR